MERIRAWTAMKIVEMGVKESQEEWTTQKIDEMGEQENEPQRRHIKWPAREWTGKKI